MCSSSLVVISDHYFFLASFGFLVFRPHVYASPSNDKTNLILSDTLMQLSQFGRLFTVC
jgi:hypothetical protein